MSGVKITVTLDGLAASPFTALADLGEHMLPVYDEIGAAMVASQQRRFELGVEPDGTPWMQSWRARHNGGKTLIDTGMLLSRLTHNADETGVEWGFNDRRAPILHFGAVIRPKTKKALAFVGADGHFVVTRDVVIPARPMIGVDREDVAEIGEIIADAVTRAISRGAESAP